MTQLFRTQSLVRAGLLVVIVGVVWVMAVAQNTAVPYALFQQASLTGTTNAINATNIPVVTSTGAVVYLNAKIQFNADANGNLTIASGFPQISPSPTLLTSGFKAGTYVGPSTVAGGNAKITVSGPGVTDGGATMWSLTVASGGSSSTYPSSAIWYTGAIANNPNSARISQAGITSTAFSYGTSGALGPNNCPWWFNGALIGASQTGNTLTLVTYSGCSGDSATPADQITYTLVPGQ
jgi:hypothetical protein